MILESELVLVHVDEKPGFYARVEEILPDTKPGWWQVKLLVLTFPLQVFTWILDEDQLSEAPFTMGGTPLRLEKLVSPVEVERRKQEEVEREARKSQPSEAGQKVVSLADRRKK